MYLFNDFVRITRVCKFEKRKRLEIAYIESVHTKTYYTYNNIKWYVLNMGGLAMEETLYGIEIQKDGSIYVGRMYSDVGGVKEFKSHKIELLLRDMTYDMRLALDEFSKRSDEFTESKGQIK